MSRRRGRRVLGKVDRRDALCQNPCGPHPSTLSANMIVGLGTDIVEIVRIGEMIERHGELFLQRVYTEREIRYCQRRKEAIQHYAGRWAAKEAVMKSLGTGFTKGVGWRDIEVVSQQSGQPVVELTGGAANVSTMRGIDEILLTISHCRAYATATAIAFQHTSKASLTAPPER